MDELGQKLLAGTLADPRDRPDRQINHVNKTEIPYVSAIIDNGHILRGGVTTPGETQAWKGHERYLAFFSHLSGAFIAVATIPENNTVNLDCSMLYPPNRIGRPPVPGNDSIIPQNSPSVVVGCGMTRSGAHIVREQYWQLQQDSYCLAAGEKKTVSQTVTTGMQDTTSDQKTVAESLGVSASAGWGPISASASASLSSNSTHMHQLSINSQTTAFEQTVLENNSNESRLFLKWQLMDVIQVFDKQSYAPLASIISAVKPIIVTGPFALDSLLPCH